jgi:hypothetical protein
MKKGKMSNAAMTTIGGAVVAVVGLFLPWAEILGLSFNLWGSGAGKAVLVLALLGIFLAVQGEQKKAKGMKVGALVMALLILGLTGANAPSNDGFENMNGVYVSVVGAITMLVGTIMLMKQGKK